jgi:hypothetical protein
MHRPRRRLLALALVLGGLWFLPSCSRTVLGGYQDSPAEKFRVYGRIYGAYCRSFRDNTRKTIRVSIVVRGRTETLLTNSLGTVSARLRIYNRELRYCEIEVSSLQRPEITNVPMWSFCVQDFEVPLLNTEADFNRRKVDKE